MFTIKDLAEGKCLIINDGTLNDIRKVLKVACPNNRLIDSMEFTEKYYYIQSNHYIFSSINPFCDPSQSVHDFIKQLDNESKNNAKLEINTINKIPTQVINKRIRFHPSFGEKVLVSIDNKNWIEKIFISKITNSKYPILAVSECNLKGRDRKFIFECESYKYIKPYIINVSKKEIAKWKGCNVKHINIID